MNFHKMLVNIEQSILTACVVNRLNISLLQSKVFRLPPFDHSWAYVYYPSFTGWLF